MPTIVATLVCGKPDARRVAILSEFMVSVLPRSGDVRDRIAQGAGVVEFLGEIF
jgi:hypothetical protein